MSSDCYRVCVYQIWCQYLKPFSFQSADNQTDRQTDKRTDTRYTHAGGYTAEVGEY